MNDDRAREPSSTGGGTIPPAADPPRVSGIVLAGGRSRRFGSDKLAAELDGRTLLERAVAAVRTVADEPIVVVPPGGEAASSRALATNPGIRVVEDPEPFGGPLVGVLAGLRAARAPFALVVGGDMPWLAPDVLARLLGDLVAERPGAGGPGGGGSADPHAAVLAVPTGPSGAVEQLPCALRTAVALAAAETLVASGERRLGALLRALGPLVIPAAVWEPLDPGRGSTRDVDRPEDMAGD